MKRLTKKEKGFVHTYIDTNNGTLAVKENYDVSNDNSAAVIASNLLRKTKIQNYINVHAEDAESMIYTLSQEAKQELVRLNASKDIMDRAGFKPIEKSESKSVRVTIDAKMGNKEFEKLREEYEEKLKAKLL